MDAIFKDWSLFRECRAARLKLWQCPPFLFIVMGIVTIISMVATYLIASRYTQEPEIAALLVIFVTVFFLIIGNLIVAGFNHIAEANHMKSEFISIISHQLRSPLSIFKWTLDVLEREEKQTAHNPALAATFLRTLRDNTENMIRLVNSLLEVSRIEARTIVLRSEPVDIAALTHKITERIRAYAHASNVELKCRMPSSGIFVQGDEERIAMVVQNLIDNAIRYTLKEGEVEVEIEQKDSRVIWKIQDQGVGIPSDDQRRIFQKFFRAENARNQEARGTGIGLYMAKAVIEALKGEIGFNSKEGRGSTFWFTLSSASPKRT